MNWTRIGEFVKRDGHTGLYAMFRCACGAEKLVRILSLKKPWPKSAECASCASRRAAPKRPSKRPIHGHARQGAHSPTFKSWCGAFDRCYRAASPKFPDYGGRGIIVCDRWHEFANFLADMGERPSREHSLDRIDVNGNYEPGNCRWATAREQAQNQRRIKLVEHSGEKLCVAEWERQLGFAEGVVKQRLAAGWDTTAALTVPARHYNRAS